MFPRLRQQLLARADLLVELATLGEYGLDETGRPMPLDCEPNPTMAATMAAQPRSRNRCDADAFTAACVAADAGVSRGTVRAQRQWSGTPRRRRRTATPR